MGEICFNFKANTEPGFETAFRFSPVDSTEYGFAYQRYIALSDASIFNSPVSITKVAAGLSALYGLFIEKNVHPTTYINLLQKFDKIDYNLSEEVDNNSALKKVPYNMSIVNKLKGFTNPYSYNFNIYQDSYNLNKPLNHTNIYERLDMQRHYNGLSVDDINFFMNKDFVLNHNKGVNNLKKTTGQEANIYSKMFNLSKEWSLNIQDYIILDFVYDLKISLYDVYTMTPFVNRLNMINNFFGSTDNLIINPAPQLFGKFHHGPLINIIDNFMVSPEHGIVINMLKDILSDKTKPYSKILDSFLLEKTVSSPGFFEELQAKKTTSGFNILEQFFGELPINVPFMYDIISANVYGKYMSSNNLLSSGSSSRLVNEDTILHGVIDDVIVRINSNVFISRIGKTFIENHWIGCSSGIENINSFTHVFIDKTTTGTNYTNNIASVIKKDKEACYSKDIYGYKNSNPTCWLDLGTFAITERKHIITMPHLFVTSSPEDIYESDMICGTKFSKSFMEDDMIIIDSVDKYMFYESQLWVTNKAKVFQFDKTQRRGRKKKANTDSKSTAVWVYPVQKDISKLYIDCHISKYANSIFDKDIGLSALRQKKDINVQTDCVFVAKRRLPIWELSNVYVYKGRREINVDDIFITGYKERNQIQSFVDDIWINKRPSNIETWSFITGIKYPKSIVEQQQLWIDKCPRDIAMYRQLNNVFKDSVSIDTFDIDSAIKNLIPIEFINDSFGYAGLMIPISKIRNQAYIDSITKTGIKVFKDSCINKDTSGSVIEKPVALPDDDLFFDKGSHDIYIEYRNLSIVKNKIKVFVSKDVALNKSGHQAWLTETTSVSKSMVESWIESNINTLKSPNNGFIKDTLSGIQKYPKEVYDNNGPFLKKMPNICYYDYGTWAKKIAVNIQMHQQLFALKSKHPIEIIDLVPKLIRKDLRMWYEDVLFGERPIRESNLSKEINMTNRIAYDLSILPNDIKNWAWVYETPDPFSGDQYGLDELLLPENDTRYKDFEDIIFDKERMRPKNPVKIVNENTFIAKFPTKHPTPKYEETGIVYIDVETSVMHTIFLKFYRIWQTKIFEFGIMTMTQSVKQMLEYMYAWIMDYFPVEQIEEALRVFRLIRWYGETSIIQNSQYIITYEYGILESKLTTGKCLIPNDLDTNDTMYVDGKLGIIRNNVDYIGSYGAYVTFTISNKKNTTFTFSLSNTVGSVNIYINDSLVDIVSKSALNLTYELPYIGDDNIVKIEKTVVNNLNGTFYIGNIRIPNGTFKDLSIEFDPTLKAGNKPLNEIAKKMVAFANLYENREEMYDVIRKGNLGVNELYKRLEEYWKIHHQDKIKGKRLTIKET